jgi:hypothetical protein
MTSTSVGWVLLDSDGSDATILDDDAFDIQPGAEGDTSLHVAAVRGAQAIATASGHNVGSIKVTWTEDVEADATSLLKSLADLGFDNVHSVSLTRATRAWGIEAGRESEHAKTALCILEPRVATMMIVATGAGSVRTAVTENRETAEDLIEWLRTVFRKDGWLPESLYLVGPHADLDAVTQSIAEALPIPVSDSVDTQLALARGAAVATLNDVDAGSPEAPETPPERTWRMLRPTKTAPAMPETVVADTVSQVDTVVTQVIEKPPVIEPARGFDTPPDQPRVDRPARGRPWPVAHAKKLTIGAAAVAVFGAALSLAAGSALNVETASSQAADPAASGESVTSASIHTVPAPVSSLPVPALQPLAAEPPPVPPPPPEPLPLPAEPAAVVAPAPTPVPAPAPTVSVAPVPGPAAAPVTPVAPAAAPLAVPVVPPPAAPVVVPPPAAPAPVAPPAAPAPIAPPPPAPLEPAEPPPPDPIQQVLSPLFSSLP